MEDRPPPPDGYSSWLDYAVATMDTRSLQIEQLLEDDGEPISRDAARAAAQAELDELRRRAGA